MKTLQAPNDQRGAALVEAALTMLLFVVFLFAIFEGGRFLNIQQTLTNAAREGARLSVAPFSGTSNLTLPADVTTRVQSFLNASGLNGATANITVVQNHTIAGDPTHYTMVTVQVPYSVMTIPLFTDLQVTLTGEAMMRNETNLQ